MSRLRILPVGPFGSTSTIHTWRGYSYVGLTAAYGRQAADPVAVRRQKGTW